MITGIQALLVSCLKLALMPWNKAPHLFPFSVTDFHLDLTLTAWDQVASPCPGTSLPQCVDLYHGHYSLFPLLGAL